MHLLTAVRRQADACAALGSAMYAELLSRVADDIAAGGAMCDVLAGHERDPGDSALALRLLGSVHRLVLDGSAADLAAYYPSAGGSWDAQAAWPVFVRTVRRHTAAVRRGLDQPPQTNEVGRAAALAGGLVRLGREHPLPVRLFEIGASAGLNLLADEYCYVDEHGGVHGRVSSPVRLEVAWAGVPLRGPIPRIVERAGSDIAPVDATTEPGRLTLMSYVWPDQHQRLHRLRAALDVVPRLPVPVRAQDARGFVEDLDLADGTVTVLWHSVMWQYMPRPDQQAVLARLDTLAARANAHRVLAHLVLEPTRRTAASEPEFLVVLRTWPTGERRVLGSAGPHGLPTVWE